MKKLLCAFLCASLSAAMIATSFAAPAEPVGDPENAETIAAEGGESEGAEAGTAEGGESEGGESGDAEGAGAGDSAGGAGGPGGAGGGGGADQNYGLTNDENSVVVIKKGEDYQVNDAAGTLEIAEGGYIDDTAANGIKVTGADDQSNGIYTSSDDDEAVYTIGGDELYYTVDGQDRQFNTVIDVQGPAEDPDAECWYGVGITTLGGILNVKNAYIHTTGYRASDIYTPKGDHETNLVVKDSVLLADGAEKSFMPDFKLIVGSARATLLLGEDIWFYNTDIIARDWGAISHDSNTTDIQMYAVNTYAETSAGGYALYALNGTENFMYGSELVSPQYGMIVMGAGTAVLDSLDKADEAALQYADGEDFTDTVTADGRSILAGGCNAVVFHVNSGVMDPGTLIVNNAVVSTMPEDIVSLAGSDMNFDLDSYLLSPVKFGESWFYMKECQGSLFVTRSHGADITIGEGAELKSANGVILQTMIAYDSDAGNIFHDSTDDRELKDVTITIAAPVEGDILHQDYQRNLNIDVTSEYAGQVTTGSITAWNNLWTKESLEAVLAANDMTEKFTLDDETFANIRSCLVREEDTSAYTDVFGVNMTVEDGASWMVSGESSVLSLTVAENALVMAEEVYVDCSFGSDGYLDKTTGTKIDELTAGTYSNVVLCGKTMEPMDGPAPEN